MKLRGCSTSHFIWAIKDGTVKKVHNVDSRGRPVLMFKKLEDIIGPADAEHTSMFQDGCDGAKFSSSRAGNEHTPLLFADRKTRARKGYIVDEDEPECPSNEDNFDELTLSQFKKKYTRKKRKASESVLLTPKAEDDDSDLSEPLCKFRVKVLKSPRFKMMPATGGFPTSSSSTQLATSEPSTGTDGALLFSKDLATVNVKVEAPEVEYFECRETTHMADDPLICNGRAEFSASEFEFVPVNHELKSRKSGSFTNEGEICGFNEVSFDYLDDIENTFLVSPIGGENMELDNVENMSKVLLLPVSEVDKKEYASQSPSIVRSLEDVPPVEDQTASTSDCSQSHPYFQQTPEQVNYICGVQDSDSTIDDDHCCVDLSQVSDSYMVEEYAEGSPTNQEYGSPSLMPDYLCLPWKSHSWSSPDDDDLVSVEIKSPIPEEKQPLTSVNADVDSNFLNSDSNSYVSEDTSILQEHPSFVPANADSKIKFSNHNYQDDIMSEASEIGNSHCIKLRHPERLPLTRKAISPTSQEKLCLAMKSSELLDDMDHYKCKEKLYFGEQTENKCSSTRSEVEDNEPNVHPQQATRYIQNKVVISPKDMLKKLKNYKKGSPKRGLAPKGYLDGPRLCRSLPRLSSGCTSIQGCSESAIAFSQRQMHDIESLALKLTTELNSMKVIVEEKLLYEAYRSTSLKNEADEVKSAIKSATKAEEMARKWLSMMARDCNRFCKIMKLNEDNNTSASASDPSLRSIVQEKPLQREKKKISFADEAGGTLCDVKVFQNDRPSLELKEMPESSLA